MGLPASYDPLLGTTTMRSDEFDDPEEYDESPGYESALDHATPSQDPGGLDEGVGMDMRDDGGLEVLEEEEEYNQRPAIVVTGTSSGSAVELKTDSGYGASPDAVYDAPGSDMTPDPSSSNSKTDTLNPALAPTSPKIRPIPAHLQLPTKRSSTSLAASHYSPYPHSPSPSPSTPYTPRSNSTPYRPQPARELSRSTLYPRPIAQDGTNRAFGVPTGRNASLPQIPQSRSTVSGSASSTSSSSVVDVNDEKTGAEQEEHKRTKEARRRRKKDGLSMMPEGFYSDEDVDNPFKPVVVESTVAAGQSSSHHHGRNHLKREKVKKKAEDFLTGVGIVNEKTGSHVGGGSAFGREMSIGGHYIPSHHGKSVSIRPGIGVIDDDYA